MAIMLESSRDPRPAGQTVEQNDLQESVFATSWDQEGISITSELSHELAAFTFISYYWRGGVRGSVANIEKLAIGDLLREKAP